MDDYRRLGCNQLVCRRSQGMRLLGDNAVAADPPAMSSPVGGASKKRYDLNGERGGSLSLLFLVGALF
jgi:hypothetical protein